MTDQTPVERMRVAAFDMANAAFAVARGKGKLDLYLTESDKFQKEYERVTETFGVLLNASHSALRAVDASDTTAPQTEATLNLVTNAIETIESIAREAGWVLPEFQGLPERKPE